MRNILFLCTGNSARSVMAESYMTHASDGAWRGWSAGSKPTDTPNPFALETLRAHGIEPVSGDGGAVRSKSWDEFAAENAPIMDVVVTVCDNAAGEVCPIWPTRPGAPAPRKLHWSFPDPAAATGSDADKRAAFKAIFADIRARIDAFLSGEAD
ncbi:arsenate reductase ArsC [Parvularcula flava]|uniref:ArsR family transcriptional regulator n=1 Tax=Aquisalinus luteolus TaxID=1566827 RepID=A0A8J3A801_9PROT|nr:arsenate reductase ArsC [Aquisalinus luteolus]NHK28217.1 arsenate reductase ArsC [Aquisalinus luteolus]GGH97816.1 ArsR family transcriptional regulator [Aquisalinus luteolus]